MPKYIHIPYVIHEMGIDGNRHFGLNKLISAIGSAEHRYGSLADVVIHPGVVHAVTATSVDVDIRQPSSDVSDLITDYKIAAEGISLIEDRKVVSGEKIWTTRRR